MRKLLILTLGPALPVLLAAAALAACDGDDPGTEAGAPDRSTTTETTEAPTTEAPAAPSTTTTSEGVEPAPSTTPAAPPTTVAPTAGATYVCPEGGIDAVRELQESVDAGHQPWRLSATDVAGACTYGVGASTVEPAGTDRFRVTKTATGEQVLVTVAQPLGPGTIWAVTQITPA
jgi:hypothetical protein